MTDIPAEDDTHTLEMERAALIAAMAMGEIDTTPDPLSELPLRIAKRTSG